MKSSITLTDQELIQNYLNGNNESFSTLLLRHKTKIFTSILLLVKDKPLAEDIFQDTFIKIIDLFTSGKYNEEGKFLQLAMRIAHNLCVDHFRKMKRMPSFKAGDDRDVFDTITTTAPGIDYFISKNETYSQVSKMLDMLSEEQREVIVMRHYANLSFKEIASLTKCSVNTALGRMRYGLMKIRSIMEKNQVVLA